MTDYLLLALSSFFMAVQFIITKAYQKNTGIYLRNSLVFCAVLGIITSVIFYIINGFKVEISVYSVVMATVFAMLLVAYTAIGFIIMERANIAIYTVFLMTGGMMVPYIWGLLRMHERFSPLWTAVVLLIAAYIFYSNKKRVHISKNVIFFCIMVFLINGTVSIICKEHQINPAAVDTRSFVILSGLSKAYVSAPVIFFLKKDKGKAKLGKKNLLLIAAAAAATGIASFSQLYAAINVPATMVFPITTAGTMIFTSLFNRILTKNAKKEI